MSIFVGANPVVRSNICVIIAVIIYPADAVTQVEGPFCHIIVGIPAGCQTSDDIAVVIVINKIINDINADDGIHAGFRDQVVQIHNLGGVQSSVYNSIFGNRALDVMIFNVRQSVATARNKQKES